MTAESFLDGPLQRMERRAFEERDVRQVLDRMSVEAITDRFGSPAVRMRTALPRGTTAKGTGWQPNERLPALRSDDPAVMQAIGRCTTYRQQETVGLPGMGSIHDRGRCAWCGYPLRELLAACDWAVFQSGWVEAEMSVWYADQDRQRGATYIRMVRQDVYENEAWAAFWALPAAERRARVEAAQYPVSGG